MAYYYDDEDLEPYEWWDSDEDDHDRWVCCFPGRCLMPAEHTKDECHTAGMMERWIAEGML